MTRYRCWLLAAALSLLGAVMAHAQSPASREILVNASQLKGLQFPYDITCGRSICLVLWVFGEFSEDDPPKYEGDRLAATTLAPAGGILREEIFAEDPNSVSPSVVAVGQQFAIFWRKTLTPAPLVSSVPVYRWFNHDLQPGSEVIYLPEHTEGIGIARDTAAIPGGFVQLWSFYDILLPDASDGALLTFTDAAGRELHPPVLVSPEAAGEQRVWPGGLTIDPAAGIITVVYEQFVRGDNAESDVFFRRFSLAGEPLTPEVRVNSHLPDWQTQPAVATAPDGDFTVIWTSDWQDGSHDGIFGQRFSREATPLGPEFQINQETLSDQRSAQIASDSAGNFVAVWKTYGPRATWDVKARLFRTDGTPVGPEVFINKHIENHQESPLVSFAPSGTFVVTWNSFAQVPPANDNGLDVFARRFSASPADEPCVATPGKLSCDTGRTGGELEVQHGFGGPGSGLPFLGDVDGDGREDPCLYSEGVFRCDADHEGGAAEVLIPFKVPGATVPLLGDVDGDGRDDPCLFGAGAFHCDTRHDGGAAEVRIVFGQKGETPLLGDINGDGRADACAFAGGLFRCDTAHNGGKAELLLPFGRRGDQPLLGDFDGDGRDDPCVFRKGNLLCDTAHDGGAAEAMLSLGGAKGLVVLGNLDGL